MPFNIVTQLSYPFAQGCVENTTGKIDSQTSQVKPLLCPSSFYHMACVNSSTGKKAPAGCCSALVCTAKAAPASVS